MKRKDFIKRSFQCGVVSCLGIHSISRNSLLANSLGILNDQNDGDDFLKSFSWISSALEGDLTNYFDAGTIEFKILSRFKEGWGKIYSVELFNALSAEYGDKAIETIGEFIKTNTINYYTMQGEKEAHQGTEITDFIRVLWEPLEKYGFEFTMKEEDNYYSFIVTKCPLHELAEKTNMHAWVYQMACMTDFYSTPAFSEEIGFSRTKTLVQKDDHCNHSYYYKKEASKKDSLLGYCGLYCGGCPSNQNTKALTPLNYKKENYYEACEGCNSKVKAGWCANCEIRDCNKSKDIRVCLDCKDYPCEKMQNFENDERYPYHKEVEAKMKLYKDKGLVQWLEIQAEAYICKNCGTQFNFFQHECSKCGAKI